MNGNKTGPIIRIVFYCIAIMALSSVLKMGLKHEFDSAWFENLCDDWSWHWDDDDFDDDFDTNSLESCNKYTETFSASEIDSINVNWTKGKVIVKKTTGSMIVFEETADTDLSESDCMYKSVNNGAVTVSDHKNGKNKSTKKRYLTVSVPEKLYNSVSIDTTSATIDISDVKTSNLTTDSNSGAVKLTNVTADVFDFENTSGSLTAVNTIIKSADCENVSGSINYSGKISSALSVNTVSGSVDVETSTCPKNGTFNSVSGSVNITLPKNSGFTADCSSMSGSFNSNFSTTNNGDKYVCGDGSAIFSFDSVSGSVNINSK